LLRRAWAKLWLEITGGGATKSFGGAEANQAQGHTNCAIAVEDMAGSNTPNL
jgi:hypothetical protein